MAKKKDFDMEIIEMLGTISEGASGWIKGVAKVGWGDNQTTVDVRRFNMEKNIGAKGISLSDIEADELTHILLDNDYGNIDELQKAVERRKSRFIYGDLSDMKKKKEPEVIDISWD